MTLAERLGAALARPPSGALSAGDFADLADEPATRLTAAAVLVAITDRTDPGVILTQRTDTLRTHAGQVAFPGGRLDPGETVIEAALREAEEEIALPPALVTVVGAVDRYRTGSGFEITPVLAVIPPDLPLVPAEVEVASVFEVPLGFVLDLANHRPGSGWWRGEERHFVEIPWQGRRIWGATAAMLVNLSRRLAWA